MSDETSKTNSTEPLKDMELYPDHDCEDGNVWASGGYLALMMPDGIEVTVPNEHSRAPTRSEMIDAIIKAGYKREAAETKVDTYLRYEEDKARRAKLYGGRKHPPTT